MMDRFRIQEPKLWGQLVKKWIKGEQAKPRTLEELSTQMRGAGMTAPEYPAYLKGLVFVEYDKHILMIRLPPAELVKATEDKLNGDQADAYPLPSFYDEFYSNPQHRTGLSKQELLDLHAARIGEYTVNLCE
jgi:hypothetical protein